MRLRPVAGRLKRQFLSILFPLVPNFLLRRFLMHKKHQWVFIIGSTLLQDLLSAHPEISGMHGEGQYRTKALLRDNDRLFGEKKEAFYLTEADDANYLRVYYDWYFETKGDRKILLEKTPVNSMRMRWLQQWFAPAKFIVIARSPYGVCEGMSRKTGISVEQAAKNWDDVYKTIAETLPFIKHALVMTYDELTEDTERTLDSLVSFLELSRSFSVDENQQLKIHEQTSAIQNMDYKSIERLSEEALGVINKACADTMKTFNLKIVTGKEN